MENTYHDDFENIILTEDDYFREALDTETMVAGVDYDNRNECGHALHIIVQAMYTASAVLEAVEKLEKGEILPIIGNQEITLENVMKTDKVAISQGIELKTLAIYCFAEEYKKAHKSTKNIIYALPQELRYNNTELKRIKETLLQRCKIYAQLKRTVLYIAEKKKKIGFSENGKGILQAGGIVWQLVHYDGYDFYKTISMVKADEDNFQYRENRGMPKVRCSFTPYSMRLQEQCEKEVRTYILKNRQLLNEYNF